MYLQEIERGKTKIKEVMRIYYFHLRTVKMINNETNCL